MSAERILLHQDGLKHFYQGNLDMALALFEKAQKNYGSYIGIQCDIAACHYLSGNFRKTRESLRSIERVYGEVECLLSSKSKINSLVFMAKIQEEEGEISKALKSLKIAAVQAAEDANELLPVYCQIVRLTGTFGIKQELAAYYRLLLQAKTQNANVGIEIEHSLMLAEGVLFGHLHMQTRFETLLNKSLNPLDLRLVAFDYFEFCLSNRIMVNLSKEILQKFEDQDLDLFEKILRDCVGGVPLPTFKSIMEKASDFSFLGLLRVLSILMARETDSDIYLGMKKQFIFLLESCDPYSKAVLLNKWNASLNGVLPSKNEQALSIALKEESLYFGSHVYCLKRQQGARVILKLFVNRKVVSVDDVSEAMGCLYRDETSINRVRVAIQRLNKILAKITGFPKLFILRAGQIELQHLSILEAAPYVDPLP